MWFECGEKKDTCSVKDGIVHTWNVQENKLKQIRDSMWAFVKMADYKNKKYEPNFLRTYK